MTETAKEVYLVDGARTPFLKAKGARGPFSAADLAVGAARELLSRLPIEATDLDEVITGCMIPSPDESNISRIIALRLGCGKKVPAYTVQRNCASGMQALDDAFKDIKLGRHDLVLAGGTEAMSRSPLLFNDDMVAWFSAWFGAKTTGQRLQLLTKLKFSYLAPVISLLRGLRDPLVGLSMGQTAEVVAHRFGITREEMDQFALESHLRVAKAQDAGHFKSSIEPLIDQSGTVYEFDDGLRRDSSMEKLAKLKPFFDKQFGSVTAANSSQVTDGAAFCVLASKAAVKKFNLPVLSRVVDVEWAGVDPSQMGLGPVHAVVPMLQRQKLTMSDINYWEINEAFAAQVLGCIRAWADADYCEKELGLSKPFGALDLSKLNVDGGAIALGHPVGASGARIVIQLANILKREKAKLGVAAICIGGGQGGAMLLAND